MYDSRLTRIMVENLFGKYDYNINLQNESDVAIIIAPNGCGKTTIFKMLNFVLSPSIDKFKEIDGVSFNSFSCEFDTGNKIELIKSAVSAMDSATNANDSDESIRIAQLEIEHDVVKALGAANYIYRIVDKSNKETTVDFFDFLVNKYSELQSIGIYEAGVDYIEAGDGSQLLVSRMLIARLSLLFNVLNEQLKKNYLDANPMFISANRTQTMNTRTERIQYANRRWEQLEEPVVTAKEKIESLILPKIKEYDRFKDNATNRIVRDYINSEGFADRYEDFIKSWKKYKEDISKYIALGLVPADDRIEEPDSDSYYRYGRPGFFNLFLTANSGNTAPLRGIYNKLSLFKEIFDQRNAVTDKKIFFTHEGVKIVDVAKYDGSNINVEELPSIDIEKLSSGEKNDFIMFYDLIFDSEKNGLILIDEPEISLHISWQEDYLDKLLGICNEIGKQAIVSTHSPNIINGHYELIVEKQDV